MPAGLDALLVDSLDEATSELDQAVTVLERFGHEALDLTLAVGDRLLLDLARQLTGRAIELTAGCLSCGEINEITVTPDSLPAHWPRSRWLGPNRGVREPTYRDLQHLPDDHDEALAALAGRCCVGVVPVEDALAALEELDDSLAGPIESACVECGAVLLIDADLEHVALSRLRLVTEQLERDIHLLASTYQWDLATIHALSATRRRRLVNLIEADR